MKYLKIYPKFIIENESSNKVKDASITNLAELDAESIEDISFKFSTKKITAAKRVISHEIITIQAFNLDDKKDIKFPQYHLIFGEDSLAIFNAFGVEEVAGLTKDDCLKHINGLKKQGKTEMMDGAFIAGLCNWVGDQLFCFFNVGRMSLPGFANRVIPHESLHMARNLISLEANEYLRTNVGKDRWWEDERATFAKLEDENEEYFAEVLERCSAISYDRWEKITGANKRKDSNPVPLQDKEYKSFSGKKS